MKTLLFALGLFLFVGAKTRPWADTGMVSASTTLLINFVFSTRWVEIKAIVIGKSNEHKNLLFKI